MDQSAASYMEAKELRASGRVPRAEALRTADIGDAPSVLIVETIVFVISLPFLPFVLGLRRAGVLPWTIQARCRPWGRRGPATVLRWRVKGDAESRRALQDIVAALERGSDTPVVAGAERVT